MNPQHTHNLLTVLHRALVETRNLALAQGNDQIADLADTFEVIPELMAKGDAKAYDTIRSILSDYQNRHPESGYDYVTMLESTEPASTS